MEISLEQYNKMAERLTELEYLLAERPEIIRCKDCAKRKYCRTSTVWAVAPDDDWYCADAARRTDE